MLEAFSTNQTIPQNGAIPLNSVALSECDGIKLNGVSSIQFYRCGVYAVSFDFEGTPSEGGALQIALKKDGVIQDQSTINLPLVATTVSASGSRKTYVQVPFNKSQCKCSVPTTISFENLGVGLTNADFHVTIERVN